MCFHGFCFVYLSFWNFFFYWVCLFSSVGGCYLMVMVLMLGIVLYVSDLI